MLSLETIPTVSRNSSNKKLLKVRGVSQKKFQLKSFNIEYKNVIDLVEEPSETDEVLPKIRTPNSGTNKIVFYKPKDYRSKLMITTGNLKTKNCLYYASPDKEAPSQKTITPTSASTTIFWKNTFSSSKSGASVTNLPKVSSFQKVKLENKKNKGKFYGPLRTSMIRKKNKIDTIFSKYERYTPKVQSIRY